MDLGDAADLSNVAVTNAAGQVLYVDARNIIATGTDMIQVPGTFDIFQTLISIRDILNNNHSLPDNQITTLLPKAMDWITEVNELVVEAQVSIGSRTSFLDNLKETIENMQANTQDEASLLEQADIAQIAIDLSRRQTLYQMTLSVAGKLMSITLLDFLK